VILSLWWFNLRNAGAIGA